MGISASWIGIKGRSKPDVLAELDLTDTGNLDPEMQARFCCAERPEGWLIVFSDDFEFASPRTIADLSQGGLAIGSVMEEHVMFSGLRAYGDGQSLWSVTHDPEEGLRSLSVTGTPPEVLASIRDDAVRQQEEAGGEGANVDFLFDVPMDLAKALTGFRHDEDNSNSPTFTVLERAGRTRRNDDPGKGGWLATLFGRKR